jgi:hypothetical protein
MEQENDGAGAIYSVCIKTILDDGWLYALQLDPVETQRHYAGPPRTVITVRLADQAQLLGLLNRLHDMGLTLLSIDLHSLEMGSA